MIDQVKSIGITGDETNETKNMSPTEYYVNLENTYGANNYHPLDVVIQRGEGV